MAFGREGEREQSEVVKRDKREGRETFKKFYRRARINMCRLMNGPS